VRTFKTPPILNRLTIPLQAQEEEPVINAISVASRVAAAQAALKAVPPTAPRRTSTTSTSTMSSREQVSGPASTGATPAGLLTAKAGISSLFKKSQPPPPLRPASGPALGKERAEFAPPPQRVNNTSSAGVGRKSPQPARSTPLARAEEPVEQEQGGEWAEALYDFSSDDSGDLSITAGERLVITERNSKDWWTAESDNGRGLVPAAYVKIL